MVQYSHKKERGFKIIDLEKHEQRKEKVKINLEKLKIVKQKAQVLFFIDNSGSMSHIYSNGEVQEMFERVLPLANVLDDDGKMPVYSFNNNVFNCGESNISNAEGFINRHIRTGGGTNYSPIIKVALKEKKDIPTLAIIITDGNNFDKEETTKAIKEASKENIFFQFIGIGYETFDYLNKINTISGRYVDNVGFFQTKILNSISDEDLYYMLIKEFPSWLKKFSNKKNKKGLFGFLK